MNLPSYLKAHWKLITLWVIGIIAGIVLLMTLAFYFAGLVLAPTSERSDQVAAFVNNFGDAVPKVSLASSSEEIAASMDANYSDFLSPDLLQAWKNDPTLALGTPAAGPKPVGIRLKSVRNVGTLSYLVKAYLLQETPVVIPGLGTGIAKTEAPITLGVAHRGGSWRITEYAEGHAGSEESAAPVPGVAPAQ